MSAKGSFPHQIRYIIGNEAAERFSFYGMRSILVIYMVKYLEMAEHEAKGVFHLFVSANYFVPLFGAYLSDRYFGKYRTIIWLSLVYCLGHAVLAIWEGQSGLYWGLGLIAIGAGGIKPCVSAHVGDQFNETNSHLLQKVYEIFYWSINFGSFFSTLLIPWVLPHYGPSWAFGIPGILMGIATLVFWMGRTEYVHVPPTGKENSPQFFGIIWYTLTHLGDKKPGQRYLDVARAKYSDEKVDGALAAMDVFKVFIWVIAFWALFDQHSSSWVLQAERMDRTLFGYTLEASQIPALNPILVLVLIPIFSLGIYPLVGRLGITVTPLRKMGAGMAFAGISFVWVAVCEMFLTRGVQLSVVWQIIPFIILTASEVMVSITGLEFAYTQAPRSMKSMITSLWLLTISAGNLVTAGISYLNRFQGEMEFVFYAALMFLLAIFFIWGASKYKERQYIETINPGV